MHRGQPDNLPLSQATALNQGLLRDLLLDLLMYERIEKKIIFICVEFSSALFYVELGQFQLRRMVRPPSGIVEPHRIPPNQSGAWGSGIHNCLHHNLKLLLSTK